GGPGDRCALPNRSQSAPSINDPSQMKNATRATPITTDPKRKATKKANPQFLDPKCPQSNDQTKCIHHPTATKARTQPSPVTAMAMLSRISPSPRFAEARLFAHALRPRHPAPRPPDYNRFGAP